MYTKQTQKHPRAGDAAYRGRQRVNRTGRSARACSGICPSSRRTCITRQASVGIAPPDPANDARRPAPRRSSARPSRRPSRGGRTAATIAASVDCASRTRARVAEQPRVRKEQTDGSKPARTPARDARRRARCARARARDGVESPSRSALRGQNRRRGRFRPSRSERPSYSQ